MAISEEERGHEAECRHGECHGEQVGNAEEAHLGVGGLYQNDGDSQHQQFQQEVGQADRQSTERPRGVQAEGEKGVDEQGHQQELFDGRAPFDEAEVGSGVFQNHGLVDHGQLQMGGGVVHGNPAGFGDEDEEEGGEGEHLGGGEEMPGGGGSDPGDFREAGGIGTDGDGEDGQHHGGFGEGGDGHFAAGAQAAEGAAGIQSGEGEKEAAETEQVDQGQHAAEQAKRRAGGNHGDHEAGDGGGGEHDVGGGGEDPGGRVGQHHAFSKQLVEIAVGL